MIREIQNYWNGLEKKEIKVVIDKFQISQLTAKKYIEMTEGEIKNLNKPNNYKKRNTPMNDWLNVIYKMMQDGHSGETIYFYIKHQSDFKMSDNALGSYIYLLGKNNFPDRKAFNRKHLIESVLPSGVICFNRMEILKYLLTCNPKVKKNEELGKYINVIKEAYPVAAWIETVFKEFHGVVMGEDANKTDEFIEKYGESKIKSFCNGVKRDITPVKNAISHPESSGFVEGNNNKFKLIKRIVYGRSGLVNLEKKCKLAFLSKNEDFSLIELV